MSCCAFVHMYTIVALPMLATATTSLQFESAGLESGNMNRPKGNLIRNSEPVVERKIANKTLRDVGPKRDEAASKLTLQHAETQNAEPKRVPLRGGSTKASVTHWSDFQGKGPAVEKEQPSDRLEFYLRERDLFKKAKEAGLDLGLFPSLYDHDDGSRTLTMSYVDDTGGPPLQTVAFKNNITAELHQLALKHGIFHNDVKWDNIKYDRRRSRAVLFDFDWATTGAPGFPYYAQLHLPITVGKRRRVKRLCAVAEPADWAGLKGQDQPETVWLFSLDDKGAVLEHRRDSKQWTQRNLTEELRLPSIRACACALDDAARSRVLYFVDADGALHELQLRPSPDAQANPEGTLPRPHCISRSLGWTVHAESDVVCVAVPGAAGRGPARGIVLIDAEGRLRIATKQASKAGQREDELWVSDALLAGPPPSLIRGARIAAGTVGERVSVFYCSGEKQPHLCQATWQGPGQWTSGQVGCGGLSKKTVSPRSLAAIFDGKASIAYVSSDSGELWEVEAPGSPGAGPGKAWCMTDHSYRDMTLKKIANGPVVAGQLPRIRAEGGGLAGREVVVARGSGTGEYLNRFFIEGAGCGALEGRRINEWQMQYLTMAKVGFRSPALASDTAAAPAICALATSRGTHHIFYAAAGGGIFEL